MTWRWPTKAATCFHKLYNIYCNTVVLILSTCYHNFRINSVAVVSVMSQQFLYWLFSFITTVFCYWFCEDKMRLRPQFCKWILWWLVRSSHHICGHIPYYTRISQSHSNFSLEHNCADDTYQIVHHVSSLFPYLLQEPKYIHMTFCCSHSKTNICKNNGSCSPYSSTAMKNVNRGG
jgi:hypothetical protein